MNQQSFIETIKVKDGRFYNLPLHLERMAQTAQKHFQSTPTLHLTSELIPEELNRGLVKCRIVYGKETEEIRFSRYGFRRIESLQLVEDDTIDYTFKSTDRSAFEHLLKQKGTCDDILVVKQGLITDTSYSNVVFESADGFFTPSSFLLNGIKRFALLRSCRIREMEINVEDIKQYDRIYLINALIDLEDRVSLPVSAIHYR